MSNAEKFEKWFSGKGRDFFVKCGVKPGFKALEFGAGPGNYTVPLAQAVGETGTVYAAESDKAKYPEIEAKLKEYKISNTVIHDTGGKIETGLLPGFDFVTVYDVVHYFDDAGRNELYAMVYGTLKKGGIFSFLPKHRLGDEMPRGALAKMGLDSIEEEVKKHGFKYYSRLSEEVVHDNSFVKEYVINFIK